jgi:hypothetical protein
MEGSVVEKEQEDVFRGKVEHSDAAGLLTTLISGLREHSATAGNTNPPEGCAETSPGTDTEAKSRGGNGDGNRLSGGGT